MECKNCGTEYEGRFCPECGNECKEQGQTDCVTVCPQCGSERAGKVKFCVNCGYNYETRSSSNTATGGKINGLQSFISERKGVIYRVYRYLIAGGMLLAGVIALLCLAAPTMVEKFFGEINPLCTGFTAMIGGKGVDVPGSVVGASRALLAMSIIALIYGGVQLYWAFKRPFKTVRNYFCWALDGAIVFILLTLGAVVSAAGSSEELAGAQVGAGFAICIVMGVFGLLLLGARIFFELKLFSWADSGLSEEQIAKATEKKERKPLDKAAVKKWAKRIGIPAAIAVVLVVAIVPAVVITSNIFRIGKVDKINIGDSSDRVMEVLGEPYVKDGNFYEYYDKEYVKLSEQIKEASGIGLLAARRKDDDFDIDLDEDIDIDDGDSGADKLDKLRDKLHNLTYKYIRIEFSSDNKVTSVLFDANRCDADNSNTKKIKSYDITPESIQRYVKTDITYTVKYEDKSLSKGIAQRDVMQLFVINGYSIKWKDIYGNQLTKSVPIVDRGKPSDLEITGDVVVPDGVTALGDIFRYTKVNSVTLPKSVTKISDDAFDGCSNLSIYCYNDSIRKQFYKKFPIYVIENNNEGSYYAVDGVEYNLKDGEVRIFKQSTTLSGSIEIPNAVIYKGTSYSVTSIGGSAFSGCSGLTSIEIPAGVTSIGYSAFSGCSSLTIYCEASSKPSGWSSDWNYSNRPVVWGHNNITTDAIYDYVIHEDKVYLTKYKGSSANVIIPSTIEDKEIVSFGAIFAENSNITRIEIPAGVTRIGNSAFNGCSSLASIEIPTSVTSIGNSAFSGCSSLTSIEIPAGVTGIGDYAFA